MIKTEPIKVGDILKNGYGQLFEVIRIESVGVYRVITKDLSDGCGYGSEVRYNIVGSKNVNIISKRDIVF